MKVTINGKITNVLPLKNGVSQQGREWSSQDYVIEDENGEKLVFNVFGSEKINEYNLAVGTKASVTVEIGSREWQGKWFTSARCTECISNSAPKEVEPQPQPRPIQTPSLDAARVAQANESVSADSLPF